VKLLVVKLSALGDVVQTLPSLTLIKKVLPDAEVDWVVDERNADILKGNPLISRLIPFSNAYFKSIKKFKSFVSLLKEKTYDWVLDYQGLLKSGIVTCFAKAHNKAGFKGARELSPIFYDFKVDVSFKKRHAVDRYLLLTKEVLIKLGVNPEKVRGLEGIPECFWDESLVTQPLFYEKYKPLKDYIVIVPEARWQSKVWPYSYWEEFFSITSCIRSRFEFVVTGSGKDKALVYWASQIEKKFSGVFNLVGKLSLRELVSLLKFSQAIVTVDTGPMHIACALEKKGVAIFGPTSPKLTGPWKGAFVVLSSKLPCSPCFKKRCELKSCLKEVTPYQVLSALNGLIVNP